MNYGTKLRTVLGVLTTINTVLAVTDITQFGNDTLTFWYKLVSVIINAIIVGVNTYYNNDYTPEAAIGTGITRQLKLEKEMDYIGDKFYTEEPYSDDENCLSVVEEFVPEEEGGDIDE